MLRASPPSRFTIPFANSAGGSFIRPIPQASQIGIQNGAASLTDGFPPLCFQPVASGGTPPFGSDMNGVLNQLSSWAQWQEAGGPVFYDATFATGGSGGYPQGATVQSNIVLGNYWMSTVDNNTTDPDAAGAGWVPAPGFLGTGSWLFQPGGAPITGWVISNGSTIGDASSGATQRANADTFLLFRYLWLTCSDTQCPVSGGRGANPTADFAAHKTIGTLFMQGIGIAGVDGMGGATTGLLAGVPVQSGGLNIPASIVGENLHSITATELANHTHINTLTNPSHVHTHNAQQNTGGNSDGGGGPGSLTAFANATINAATQNTSINNAAVGAGTPHNTVSRSMLVYWFIKL